MSDPKVEVINNVEARQWQAVVDGKTAVVKYQERDGRVVFIHTEVPPELEGRGIAGAMARAALDDARNRALRVVPLCPYIASYIRRHPEYQDLVDSK